MRKLGWRHVDAGQEATGLRAWSERGAVRVYAAHDEGVNSGLLLERCRPGTALQMARRAPRAAAGDRPETALAPI